MHRPFARRGFTLIELLVVIAIIAILAVVVVLTLNPAQLLAQSRDANRVSDMATLNSAIGLYQTDQGGAPYMGTTTVDYVSLTDTTSTCANLGLPTLPVGYIYDCSTSTSSRLINNQGWVPMNFSLISSGAPFGSLPIDPVNQSSSGLYYTYVASGTSYMVSAIPESQKQKAALGAKPMIPNYPDVIANGSSLTINPLYNLNGLVNYWPMDEGTGSSTQDLSGNNNLGTWLGTAAGANGTYYTGGKVGSYAGMFNGINDYVVVGNLGTTTNQGTISFWINANVLDSTYRNVLDTNLYNGNNVFRFESTPTGAFYAVLYGGSSCNYLASGMQTGQWYHVVLTWNTITPLVAGSLNGSQSCTNTSVGVVPPTLPNLTIGVGYSSRFWQGSIDDIRIYNRALSAAEIQALYSAGK